MTNTDDLFAPRAVAYSGTVPTPILSRRIAALTLAAVAVLGLSGCMGFPAGSGSSTPSASASESSPDEGSGDDSGDGTQTTAEACQLVQETIAEATAEFENVDATDPTAVVEGMEAAAESLADAASKVTNEEVAALLPDLQAMFEEVAAVMAHIVAGDASKLGELEQIGTKFQETTQRLQDLCAPAE